MRSSGGSAVGAGCGVVGLLGLLIGVGITVYLGSKALDGSRGAVGGGGAVATAEVTVGPSPAPDGSSVTVASDDFSAGSALAIVTCLRRVADGPWRCDPSTAATTTVDPLGQFRADYAVQRQVTIGRRAVDCSAADVACVLRVRQRDPIERIGSAPLAVPPTDPSTTPTGPPSSPTRSPTGDPTGASAAQAPRPARRGWGVSPAEGRG